MLPPSMQLLSQFFHHPCNFEKTKVQFDLIFITTFHVDMPLQQARADDVCVCVIRLL